jgi:hypothetical protein
MSPVLERIPDILTHFRVRVTGLTKEAATIQSRTVISAKERMKQ